MMSRIYFHTRDAGDCEVRGNERAWFGMLTENIANSVIGASLNFPNSPSNPPRFSQMDSSRFGEMVDTVLSLQSDALSFCARVHATCEIWGWVADENRAWLADIIRQGRATKLLRDGMGWEALIELLTRPGVGPVVMSYSVTEQFPYRFLHNAQLGPCPKLEDEEADEKRAEEWYDMEWGKKWDLAFAWLRDETPALNMDVELKPENWHTWRVRD